MRQETIEEAAENYADKQSDISMRQNPLEYSKSGEELWYESKVDFIAGAKYQAERMYSEVIEFAEWIRIKNFQTTSKDNWIGLDMKYYTTQELFEQFKKK
jgi:hypothetical protein